MVNPLIALSILGDPMPEASDAEGMGLLAPFASMIPGGDSDPLLLDTYPGAVAAYSLRKLRTDYAGACLRVRESGADGEADIGFSGGVLDEAALLAHCGANSGYVVTWYDQSGAGNNATQSTAGNQPRIVNAGTVENNGSYTGIEFDKNSSMHLVVGNVQAAGTDSWIYAVFDPTDATVNGMHQDHLIPQLYTGGTWNYIGFIVGWSGAEYRWSTVSGTRVLSSNVPSVDMNVLAIASSTGPTYKLYDAGVEVADNSGNLVAAQAFAHADAAIGGGSSDALGAHHFEWIVWNTDQTANNAGINSALMTAYGVS